MRKVQNECVDCGLPCIREACPYYQVVRFYCDECKEETTLYEYDDSELCIDCIVKKLTVIEGSDC